MNADTDSYGYRARILDGDSVEIRKQGAFVARARWDGRSLIGWDVASIEGAERAAAILNVLALQIEADTISAWRALPDPLDENGVDLSLIDYMLELSPADRLAWLQDAADAFEGVSDGHALQ